ncbi:hypothetical protein [Novosphingobium lindaniclasticum]
MTEKIQIVCSFCGSVDVRRDTNAAAVVLDRPRRAILNHGI